MRFIWNPDCDVRTTYGCDDDYVLFTDGHFRNGVLNFLFLLSSPTPKTDLQIKIGSVVGHRN